MCAVLMRIVFCTVALILIISHAAAQIANPYPDWPEAPYVPDTDAGVDCLDFARYWVAVATQARANGCVPDGDAWSTDVNEQSNYCDALIQAGVQRPGNVRDNAVVAIRARMAEMRLVITGNCGACAAAIDLQIYYATGNRLYQCNFSASSDAVYDRWNTDRAGQIGICLRRFTPPADVTLARQSYATSLAEMRAQIDECKRTHQPQGCMFSGCHSSNSSHSSSAVQAMPKSGNALRDSLRQRQDRSNLKDVKVIDPCRPGTRNFDPSCKQPPTNVTNSGAMDRLQGLSPSGPSSGIREQRAAPSRPAATAGPSTPAAPSTTSPLYNRPR
jgi:hypothetical protein